MRVIYIADDGKEFDDEYDCELYERKLRYSELNNILFFDKNGQQLTWSFDNRLYWYTDKVIVSTEEQLQTLHDFAEYTGFCDFARIDSCGEWHWNQAADVYHDVSGFKKVADITKQ